MLMLRNDREDIKVRDGIQRAYAAEAEEYPAGEPKLLIIQTCQEDEVRFYIIHTFFFILSILIYLYYPFHVDAQEGVASTVTRQGKKSL